MSSEDFVPWGAWILGSTWDGILARFVDGTFSSLGCPRTVRPGYCIFVVKVVLPAAMCTWSRVRLSQLMKTPTSNGAPGCRAKRKPVTPGFRTESIRGRDNLARVVLAIA